jgi:hypothetical protein
MLITLASPSAATAAFSAGSALRTASKDAVTLLA